MLPHGIEPLSMTTHQQGRSSRGPGTIARCFTTIASLGSSSTFPCSNSTSKSKAEPDAIELHEWKPTAASTRYPQEKTNSSTTLTQYDKQRAAASTSVHPSVSHGGALLRWLRGKSSGRLGGPVLLLLLLLLLSSNSPSAAEVPNPETLQENIMKAWFEAKESPAAAPSEAKEAPLKPSQGYTQEEETLQGDPELQGASSRRLSGVYAWAADMEASLRLSPRLSLYLGVFLTLSGSLLMAGGSTLMKLGLSVEEADSLQGQSCDQQWLWGFAGEPTLLVVIL